MVPAQPGLFGNVSSNPSGSALPAPETLGDISPPGTDTRPAPLRHSGPTLPPPRDRHCPAWGLPSAPRAGWRAGSTPRWGHPRPPSAGVGARMLGGGCRRRPGRAGRQREGKGREERGREGRGRKGGAPRPSMAEPEHSPRVGSFVPGAGSLFFIRLMGCGCIIPFHMLLMNHSGQCICINVQSTGGGWSGCIWPSLTFPRRPASPTRGPGSPRVPPRSRGSARTLDLPGTAPAHIPGHINQPRAPLAPSTLLLQRGGRPLGSIALPRTNPGQVLVPRVVGPGASPPHTQQLPGT